MILDLKLVDAGWECAIPSLKLSQVTINFERPKTRGRPLQGFRRVWVRRGWSGDLRKRSNVSRTMSRGRNLLLHSEDRGQSIKQLETFSWIVIGSIKSDLRLSRSGHGGERGQEQARVGGFS